MKVQTLLAFRAPLIEHPAQTGWNAQLACPWNGELIPLLSRLAHRVAVRVEQLPLRAMVPARAMLCDYMNLIPPGGDGSLLHGATDFELELIGGTLARQVVEAAADEARASRSASARDVAMAVAAWSHEETIDEFLRDWIGLSTAAGVTAADFMHVERQH